MSIGSCVAVRMENYYNKVPVVGRILDKVEVEFTIHYWKGSWNKKWEPWFQNEHPWTDGLPRGCVYLAAFNFNENGKLQVIFKWWPKQVSM